MKRTLCRFGTILLVLPLLAPTCDPVPPNTTCNTLSTTTVGSSCSRWLTGPASPNFAVDFANGQRLWTTDQGWVIPTADGTSLRLMAYGDTFWMNRDYRDSLLSTCESGSLPLPADICEARCNYVADGTDLEPRRICFNDCTTDKAAFCSDRCTSTSLPETIAECNYLCLYSDCATSCDWNKNCIDICTGATLSDPPKDLHSLCRYWTEGAPNVKGLVADNQNHHCPADPIETERSLLSNQVVFFNADVSPYVTVLNPYRIQLGSQETAHKVRHNPAEMDMQCEGLSVGVYTLDYFYACPEEYPDATCPTSERDLFFLTGTTCWNCSSTGRPEAAAQINGTGIYYFDDPANPEGSRVPFASTSEEWRPPSPYPGITILNPDVLWGYGTEMQHVRVFHDFDDPFDPDDNGGRRYIYFMGTAGPASPVHLARVEANARAISAGEFEYLIDLNTVTRVESWTPTYDADSLYDLVRLANVPSSITKRGSLYWMSAMESTGVIDEAVGPRNGLDVAYSNNGFTWTLAARSDYATGDPQPGFVYGYTWVPSFVLQRSGSLPIAFSVWKSYEGYFDDFWDYSGERVEVPDDQQFREYNTKMYWYNIRLLRPFPILDYPYRFSIPPASKTSDASNGTMDLPFNAWAMYDDNQNRHVVIEFCECGFNDDAETCREMRCDPTIPMLGGDEVYSRGQLIPNPWKAPLFENGVILDRVKFAPGQKGTGVPYVPKWLWQDQLGTKSANVILRFSFYQDEQNAPLELRENLRASHDTFCDQCYIGQLPYGDPACQICWLKADTAFQTTDLILLGVIN